MECFGLKGEAKQIVTFDEKKSKASLDADRLREIIESRPEIKNLPTIVVTIGGVARSGKSFLLNLLITYLASLEVSANECDWFRSACPIRGISWARSGKSVTHGIWMFSQPFIVTRYDGSKAAVLLVDSQGTGDNLRSGSEIDTLITYIGLQISSVQVLNVQKYLTSNELIGMELCTDYADVDDQSRKETRQEDHLFQSLLFLIRDFTSDDHTLGEDSNFFPDLIMNNENPKLKKTLEGIKKAFCKVGSYKMPYPGIEIDKATAGVWKVKKVPQDFLQSVAGLARMMFALEQSSNTQSECWKSASDLLINFEMMKHHIENDDLPPFTNPPDALQEIIMHRAFAALQKDFSNKIEQRCQYDELKSFTTKEEVEQFYDKLKKKALEDFKMAAKYRKYDGHAIAQKYLKMSNEHFKLMKDKVMGQYENLNVVRKLQENRDEFETQTQQLEDHHRGEREKTRQQIDNLQQTMEDMTEEQKAVTESLIQQFHDGREKMDKRHKEDQEWITDMCNHL